MSASAAADGGPSLIGLLDAHPALDETTVVYGEPHGFTLAELRAAVARVARTLTDAGVGRGHPVAAIVGSGASGIVAMFAVWRVGAVYMPINRRSTSHEVAALITETPVDLLLGPAEDLDLLDWQAAGVGLVEIDEKDWTGTVRRPLRHPGTTHDPDVALILRTSGTTGRPKAVLLRHSGTIDALDSSLRKLRRRVPGPRQGSGGSVRVNLIPVPLALWAGIFNTLFSLRAGFGVVLLDRFTPSAFAQAVRRHGLRSTVLAPAMITTLCDSDEVNGLAPLEIVRSITAPLSPAVARRFHDRFGILVLNSYGQTELGGEVVGWTVEDIRRFGSTKLGAAGRPYDDIDVRILDDGGADVGPEGQGHIHIRSPFRMRGYATADGPDDERMRDGFLRTGDIGRLDRDGFLWIEGRATDMINRGGLKVFPDEVEEVLRSHATVRDAAVAGVPDRRLGEVPYAWVVPATDGVDLAELEAWCRERLVPYKIPAVFIRVDALPRNDIGKLLRRELRVTVPHVEEL